MVIPAYTGALKLSVSGFYPNKQVGVGLRVLPWICEAANGKQRREMLSGVCKLYQQGQSPTC